MVRSFRHGTRWHSIPPCPDCQFSADADCPPFPRAAGEASADRMATRASSVASIEQSLSGKAWRWRAGNMDLGDGGLSDDLVAQLLMARGVARDDLDRHRNPSLRGFLPDPSIFRDMEDAAKRLAAAVTSGEKVTVYGDYDVDGATSAALLIRLMRGLLHSRSPARRLWPVRRSTGPPRAGWLDADHHGRLRRHGLRSAANGQGCRC
jgi:hypothetical protein